MTRLLLAAAAALALAAPLRAADALSGAEIRALVEGRTVEGSMTDTGRYAEFYAPDGQIRGAGYTGAWTIEGDAMCFAYDGAEKTCWQVGRAGDEVVWLREGRVLGTGALREGNPNGF
jgi:hypothetical protein